MAKNSHFGTPKGCTVTADLINLGPLLKNRQPRIFKIPKILKKFRVFGKLGNRGFYERGRPKNGPQALIRPGGHFWAGPAQKTRDFGARDSRPKMTWPFFQKRGARGRAGGLVPKDFGAPQVKKRALGAE